MKILKGGGRRVAGLAGAILISFWLPALRAENPPLLRCLPSVQYNCSLERCERTTEGFQHAESFTYDPAEGTLTFCLWTSCYSGPGRVMHSPESGERTIFGQLASERDGDDHPPLTASLTLDAQRRFVAVWRYAGAGLTFDQGACEPSADGEIVEETGENSVRLSPFRLLSWSRSVSLSLAIPHNL